MIPLCRISRRAPGYVLHSKLCSLLSPLSLSLSHTYTLPRKSLLVFFSCHSTLFVFCYKAFVVVAFFAVYIYVKYLKYLGSIFLVFYPLHTEL